MLTVRSYAKATPVDVMGAGFLVGWIPFALMREVNLEAHRANLAAKARALAQAQAEGAAKVDDRVAEIVALDREWLLALEHLYREVVRWGVRGHTGLRTEDGQDVPFLSGTEDYLGRSFTVVRAETLAVYADVPHLMAALYNEVSRVNDLDLPGKGASPPPTPSASPPNGDATTVSPPPA